MTDPFLPQLRFVRFLLAACMVAVIFAASPLPGVATAQSEAPLAVPIVESEELLTDTDSDGVRDGAEMTDDTDPSDAPVPTPTPAVVPPTQVPTIVPPTPTVVPPTQVPTAIPLTPTPVPPTQVPTSVPPTPPSTESGGISVQRIVSGSGCTQVSSTDIVPVGTAVEFRCNGADGPGNSPVSRTFSGLTAGWEYQVNNDAWRSTAGPVFSQASSIPDFTVRLRPTATVTPGSQGMITVQVATSNGTGGAHITTMGATRQGVSAPTAADLQLVCNPATISAHVNAAQIVSCTYSGKASLNTRQITLTRITVPASAGWSITSPAGSVSGTTLTILPNTAITYSATSPRSYTFSYTLAPGCTAATTAQALNLTSTFSFNTTTGITGATFLQQATRLNTSSLAVAITSNSLVWNEGYSLTDTTVSGSLMYRMVATGCSGWNIQISTSPYVHTGPNTGDGIPASNLQLIDTGNPVVISGEGTGVSRQEASGPMNTPLKVLSATAGSGNGTYDQQLDFNLTIPGRSLAGTYQSTITVTSAAAP